MTNHEHPSLPIVDATSLLTPAQSPQRTQAIKNLLNACENVGFFYLVNHGVPTSLLQKLLSLTKDFHSLPEEQKVQIKAAEGFKGYYAAGEHSGNNKHASIEFGTESTRTHEKSWKILLSPNRFPSSFPELPSILEQYIERLKPIGYAILDSILEGLKVSKSSLESLRESSDWFWWLRMLGYPSNSGTAESHTDYGFLTFLLQDGLGGLQIKDPRSDRWIDVTPVPDSLVLNLGDMLCEISGGLLKATQHRVMNLKDDFRVSVAFFYDPPLNSKISMLRWMGNSKDGDDEDEYGDYFVRKMNKNYN